MAVRRKKRILCFVGGLLLVVALLVVLENRGLAPAWFRLGKAGQETWRRATGSQRPPDSKRSEKRIRAEAEEWYARIIATHPEMAVAYKDVPNEQNGFLQWQLFLDRCSANGALDLPEDITKMMDSPEAWDLKRFSEWLAQHQEIIEEITALGFLPDQSVKGMDAWKLGFSSARPKGIATRLLLACARLSMEQGDQAAALRYLRSTMGSANHFEKIETPSLLDETVSTLMRLRTQHFALDILSSGTALSPEDLRNWQKVIAIGPASPKDLAHVQKGEWHVSTRTLALPYLLGSPAMSGLDVSEKIPLDPEAFIDASIDQSRGWSRQISDATLTDLTTIEITSTPPENLSPESAKLLEMMAAGTYTWIRGWARAQIEQLQVQAAFAVALGDEIPIEPISGKPFVFDPATGTVTMPGNPPPGRFELSPMKVPGIGK